LAALAQFLDQRDHRLVDAALEVSSGSNPAATASGPRDHGMRHSTIAVGCRRRATSLVLLATARHHWAPCSRLVGQLDLPCDGHAVLVMRGGTVAFVDDHVATLRAERHLPRVGKHVDAGEHTARASVRKLLLGSHDNVFLAMGRAASRAAAGMMRSLPSGGAFLCSHRRGCLEDAEDVGFLHDDQVHAVCFTSVPDHFADSTLVSPPSRQRHDHACSLRAPGPTAITSPSCGFFLDGAGMMMPPAVVSCVDATDTTGVQGENVMKGAPGGRREGRRARRMPRMPVH